MMRKHLKKPKKVSNPHKQQGGFQGNLKTKGVTEVPKQSQHHESPPLRAGQGQEGGMTRRYECLK